MVKEKREEKIRVRQPQVDSSEAQETVSAMGRETKHPHRTDLPRSPQRKRWVGAKVKKPDNVPKKEQGSSEKRQQNG